MGSTLVYTFYKYSLVLWFTHFISTLYVALLRVVFMVLFYALLYLDSELAVIKGGLSMTRLM